MRNFFRRTAPYLLSLLFIAGCMQALSARLILMQAKAVSGAAAVQLSDQKLVAFTFDDGPNRPTTQLLLDGLAARGIPATFFVIGNQIAGNEDLIARMEAEGHQVGSHTWDHTALTDLNRAQFDSQLLRTRQALSEILGHSDFYIRPPWGFRDERVRAWADQPLILWSVDTRDWSDRDTERVVDKILSDTRDGSIVLLHDLYPESVTAALQAADTLLAQGYTFVTVEDLLLARGIDPQNGESYDSAYPTGQF